MKECELCKVEYVGSHPDYCDSCVRDIEETMYEAQLNLAHSIGGIDYKTFLTIVEDWLERSTR